MKMILETLEQVMERDLHMKINTKKMKVLVCSRYNKKKSKVKGWCNIWNIMLYECETWTITREDMRRIEVFKMCCYRRKKKISWIDRINN